MDVDRDVVVAECLTDQEIIDQVCPPDPVIEPEEESDEIEFSEPDPPSYDETKKAFGLIKRFVESKPNAAKQMSMVYNLEDSIDTLQQSSLRQSTLHQFMD